VFSIQNAEHLSDAGRVWRKPVPPRFLDGRILPLTATLTRLHLLATLTRLHLLGYPYSQPLLGYT
jgi:hypothetical protein